MAAVATAAAQPGVSVVSMSWGFPEGQSVLAADEAHYDPTFDVPGVTFLASTGDYGVADPEYPAFSPDVVAVGGTTLTLNADNSYNSETGWGDVSGDSGPSISSGGGISLYESEPAYQQGVQSTGYRTTPDVSLVADPDTGAWIADPYNLDPSDPFEAIGGTSLSAPAWAGLVAMVDQGRAAAGEPALNASGPGEAQQALYSLPQADYNVIDGGNNGYAAEAGYNLVTGLGTPIAIRLVPDLVAYAGPGTSYQGPTVGPLQDATLEYGGNDGGGTTDVFSVFAAIPAARPASAVASAATPVAGTGMASATSPAAPVTQAPAPTIAATANPMGSLSAPATSAATSATPARPRPAAVTIARAERPAVRAEATRSAVLRAIGDGRDELMPVRPGRLHEGPLDDLIADPAVGRMLDEDRPVEVPVPAVPAAAERDEPVAAGGRTGSVPAGPLTHRGRSRRTPGAVRPADGDRILRHRIGTAVGPARRRHPAPARPPDRPRRRSRPSPPGAAGIAVNWIVSAHGRRKSIGNLRDGAASDAEGRGAGRRHDLRR